MKNSGSSKNKFNDDLDRLFQLPLGDFIAERKALGARLKKEGRVDEVNLVAALAKPSISAWTVNQLYWNHRDVFDQLMSTGQRFRQAQTSRAASKVSDMRAALDARRETLAELSDHATSLLREAGHNPSLDIIRRIMTTLEALSAYEVIPDPGRLTKDVDPPGFESLASFIPGARQPTRPEEPARVSTPKTAAAVSAKPRQKTGEGAETRQVRITAAKAFLQEAKKSLVDARSKVQSLEAAQKKADAEVKEAEKQRRDAEERLKKARAASDEAARRARRTAFEAKTATKTFEEAKLTVEKATSELESLFRSSTK